MIKRDSDDDVSKFEIVWNAWEHEAIDPIINKHVYLAYQDAVEESDPLAMWGKKPCIAIDLSEHFEVTADVKKAFLDVANYRDTADDLEDIEDTAKAFFSIAKRLLKHAENVRKASLGHK